MYKLNDRITIKKLVSKSKDENGNLNDVYEDVYKCWSGYKALSGKKFSEQNATHFKRVDSFLVRYCMFTSSLLEGDLEQYVLHHKNKSYKISYAYDIKNEKSFVDLECELIV